MNKVLDIASYFTNTKEVTSLKLQKILYYSQVWNFVKFNEKLFEEDIQAWVYGPVIPYVWDKFKYYPRGVYIKQDINYTDCISQQSKEHLEEIWSSYGHLSAGDLVDLTHSETPWKDARGILPEEAYSKSVIEITEGLKDQYFLQGGKIPIAKSLNGYGIVTNIKGIEL